MEDFSFHDYHRILVHHRHRSGLLLHDKSIFTKIHYRTATSVTSSWSLLPLIGMICVTNSPFGYLSGDKFVLFERHISPVMGTISISNRQSSMVVFRRSLKGKKLSMQESALFFDIVGKLIFISSLDASDYQIQSLLSIVENKMSSPDRYLDRNRDINQESTVPMRALIPSVNRSKKQMLQVALTWFNGLLIQRLTKFYLTSWKRS